MKSKTSYKTKTKTSLQKTASSVINIHTHRNSNISDTLPLYYNDSILSIRTNSLARTNKNYYQVSNQKMKKIKQPVQHTQKPKKEQLEHNDYILKSKLRKKSEARSKIRRLSQLSAVELENGEFQKFQKQKQKKDSSKQKSIINHQQPNYFTTNLTNQNPKMSGLLQKTNNILKNYRLYTEQLEIDVKKYKCKYNEAMRKIRKLETKDK